MSSLRALQLPASPTGFGLPGCWTLARDRAVTLDPREGGFLRVAHGAVWATLDGPHQGPANDLGDVVLRSGARIHLAPGQHVVLESFPAAANEDACFSWKPDSELRQAPVSMRCTVWRGLLAFLAGVGHTLGQWLAPSPSGPPDGAGAYAQARDQAWRTLYHLGINQP